MILLMNLIDLVCLATEKWPSNEINIYFIGPSISYTWSVSIFTVTWSNCSTTRTQLSDNLWCKIFENLHLFQNLLQQNIYDNLYTPWWSKNWKPLHSIQTDDSILENNNGGHYLQVWTWETNCCHNNFLEFYWYILVSRANPVI